LGAAPISFQQWRAKALSPLLPIIFLQTNSRARDDHSFNDASLLGLIKRYYLHSCMMLRLLFSSPESTPISFA
jgi:hypothetical protein